MSPLAVQERLLRVLGLTPWPNEEIARKARFRHELEASNVLIDCLNEIVDKYEGKIKLRGNPAGEDLDLLVSAMFGKAGKTFQAVLRLCCLGFGEDALVLLRSNVNLMINLSYILAEDSAERAGDLIAYGHLEQEKYLRVAHGARPPYMDTFDWTEIKERAERWRSVKISVKAERATQLFHYDVGYRFYSSIEHSDAWALSEYVAEWDEHGPKIDSSPSDKYVGIAFVHNFMVMANVFLGFCSCFSIQETAIIETLNQAGRGLGAEPAPTASE